MSCPICTWTKDNPRYPLLVETTYWRVVLAPNQCLLGRCVVHLKRHASSLSDLSTEEIQDWLELVKDLQSALRKAFDVRLFNWSCYMNLAYRQQPPDPHVHWWAVPRYDHPVEIGGWLFEDPHFGSPYDHARWLDVPPEVRQGIVEQLTQALSG